MSVRPVLGLRRASLRLYAVALILLTSVALGVSAPPASAHTSLSSSVPAAGSNGAAPDEVRLTFSEKIQRAPGTAVTVSGPQGVIRTGTPGIAGSDVTVRPSSLLTPAAYSIAYRVIAQDGHPVTGRLAFSVAGSGASPSARAGAAGAATGPTPAAAPAPAPASAGDSNSPTVLWVILGVLALVAAGGFAQLVRQTRAGTR